MASDKREIEFFNDEKIYNTRYRSHLMNILRKRGYKIYSTRSGVFKIIFRNRRRYIVGSNIKTNLKLLVFARRASKTLIINGLGRYRSNFFLSVLKMLISWQKKDTRIVVQNYADFRFLRRYSKSSVVFVCGSGGTKRNIRSKGYFVISRDTKIASTISSLNKLARDFSFGRLNVVGVSEGNKVAGTKLNLILKGYQRQDDILCGNVFVCPSGYGEGFPHTLADAIVSGCDIILEISDFVRFGLYKYQSEYERIGDSVMFKPNVYLKTMLSIENINNQYQKQII